MVFFSVKNVLRFIPAALVLTLVGCSSAYYSAMEKFGVAKRDILADRVDATREAQQEAKDQFANALDRFLAITQVDGGDLQQKYEALNRDFQRSEVRAEIVRERIDAVEDVADALFREWKQELEQYTNAKFRSESERQLETTQRRYVELMELMKRAAERMEPVLATFRDQILFLKHNLNARAVSALGSTHRELEAEISQLISDMETSIREAEMFIKELESNPTG